MSETRPMICACCADEYDEEAGDVCECGAEVCSPACMDAHRANECEMEENARSI